MLKCDLTNQRFGNLIALSHYSVSKNDRVVVMWRCVCDCGNSKDVCAISLIHGRTKTCFIKGCRFMAGRRSRPRSNVWGAAWVYRGYKQLARRMKRDFTLTLEEFAQLLECRCHYCGIAPSTTARPSPSGLTFLYNGIDRIDSSVGYVSGNARSCCWTCNRMKSSLSESAFIEHVTRIANRQPTPKA